MNTDMRTMLLSIFVPILVIASVTLIAFVCTDKGIESSEIQELYIDGVSFGKVQTLSDDRVKLLDSNKIMTLRCEYVLMEE